MKQKFRIGHVNTIWGLHIEFKALNTEAQKELYRYHPELQKYTGTNVANNCILFPANRSMRRYLPPLMRL